MSVHRPDVCDPGSAEFYRLTMEIYLERQAARWDPADGADGIDGGMDLDADIKYAFCAPLSFVFGTRLFCQITL